MTKHLVTFRHGQIYDGHQVLDGYAAQFADGVLCALAPEEDIPAEGKQISLGGDILSPGYVDLQVNGGGGVMFNEALTVESLQKIAQAHRQLGVSHLLPTLITDHPEVTRRAISATRAALAQNVPGIAGLHLEGPHLSVARKGAHDGSLIRKMTTADLELLLNAARALPVLKVTLAPENATQDQVATLSRAGVLISLGHTDADFQTCMGYFAAGARCVTHLFNAMSQMGSRTPGLVGAALASGQASAGLIADGVHVHPDVMRVAWASKAAPGRIFLVSDAMAVAGTSLQEFRLGGRNVHRRNGELRLSDGTLAGADLDLTRAISIMVQEVGVDLEKALEAVTGTPARLIGLPNFDLRMGLSTLDTVIRIRADLSGLQCLEHRA